jgi:integrase
MKAKSRKRTIPIFPSAVEFLKAQIELAKSKGSVFLFSDESGNHLEDLGYIRGQKGRDTKWYGLLNRCGLEVRPFKNCRHTFAVELIRKRIDLRAIADLLGHSNMRMVIQHYGAYIKGASDDIDFSSFKMYEREK